MKLTSCKIFDKRLWLDLIAPNRCAFCDEIIRYDKLCCEECETTLPYIDKKLCVKCGKASCICDENINFDRCFSVVWYDKSMVGSVVRFKNETPDNFSGFFAIKLAEILKNSNLAEFDLVTCTPSDKSSVKRKGFNHAEVLSRCVAKLMELEFDGNVLIKSKAVEIQHTLNYEERHKNAQKAFSFNEKKNIRGKKILICDDVITTGSTLNACSKLLKDNGAELVVCAVACNTLYNKETV